MANDAVSKMSADELLAKFPEVRAAVFRQHRSTRRSPERVTVDGGTVVVTPLRVTSGAELVPVGADEAPATATP